MPLALCNPNAFYPLRSLVQGPIRNAADLPKIERFIRAIVLHDEVKMLMDPWPDPGEEPEWRDEEIAAGGRNLLVAIGPTIEEYENLGLLEYLHDDADATVLNPDLLQLARESANNDEGPYFDAHVQFIKRLVSTEEQGGSIVSEESLADEVVAVGSRIPNDLFANLDGAWAELLAAADQGNVGLSVPPFLAIVLSRCQRRDAILRVIADLKEEFGESRRRLWNTLTALRDARTPVEFNALKRELAVAGERMNPANEWPGLCPVRTLWQIGSAAVGGAAVGALQGNPVAGAAAAVVNEAAHALGNQGEFRALFRRGAFDLARRVNVNLQQVPRIPELMRPLLTAAERANLGLD